MKPKWKTSEFWIVVILTIVGFVLASGSVEESNKIIGIILLVASSLGYTVNRTMIKKEGSKPGFKTTEFWLTAISSATSLYVASEMEGGAQMVGGIGAAISAAGYPPARAVLKNKTVAALLLCVFFSGCSVLSDVDKSNYEIILPEYKSYIESDEDLEQDKKERRLRLIKSIERRYNEN